MKTVPTPGNVTRNEALVEVVADVKSPGNVQDISLNVKVLVPDAQA